MILYQNILVFLKLYVSEYSLITRYYMLNIDEYENVIEQLKLANIAMVQVHFEEGDAIACSGSKGPFVPLCYIRIPSGVMMRSFDIIFKDFDDIYFKKILNLIYLSSIIKKDYLELQFENGFFVFYNDWFLIDFNKSSIVLHIQNDDYYYDENKDSLSYEDAYHTMILPIFKKKIYDSLGFIRNHN